MLFCFLTEGTAMVQPRAQICCINQVPHRNSLYHYIRIIKEGFIYKVTKVQRCGWGVGEALGPYRNLS